MPTRPAPPRGRVRPLTDPFADRASLVCRLLLETPGEEWTVRGLAEAADVAPMISSDVVRQLESHHIVVVRHQGRSLRVRLNKPDRLLERWTTRYHWERNAILPVSLTSIDDATTMRRLAEGLGRRRWALTMLAGAWRRIKYTPTDVTHVYVECASAAELRAVAERAGWPPDPTGWVVLMRPTYTTSVWHAQQQVKQHAPHHAQRNIPIVSDIQLIVDLWHYPVRGRETAEQLWAPIHRGISRAAKATKSA